FCNDAAGYLFGEDRDKLIGGKSGNLLFRDGDPALRWSFAASPMVASCGSGRSWGSTDPLYVHTSVEVKSVSVSANSLNLPGEPFSGVVIVVRDVSEHQSSAEQLAREGRRFSRKKMFREMVLFDRGTGLNIGRLLNISVDGFKLFTRQALQE